MYSHLFSGMDHSHRHLLSTENTSSVHAVAWETCDFENENIPGLWLFIHIVIIIIICIGKSKSTGYASQVPISSVQTSSDDYDVSDICFTYGYQLYVWCNYCTYNIR